MATTSSQPERSFDACDRFFSVTDLVESRMARGCGVHVLYFPDGKSMENESSCVFARDMWLDESFQRRGLTEVMSRVEIQSTME